MNKQQAISKLKLILSKWLTFHDMELEIKWICNDYILTNCDDEFSRELHSIAIHEKYWNLRDHIKGFIKRFTS